VPLPGVSPRPPLDQKLGQHVRGAESSTARRSDRVMATPAMPLLRHEVVQVDAVNAFTGIASPAPLRAASRRVRGFAMSRAPAGGAHRGGGWLWFRIAIWVAPASATNTRGQCRSRRLATARR